MKIEDLEKKIAVRANAVTQEKINQFKREIDAALSKLFGTYTSNETFGSYHAFDGKTGDQYAIGARKLFALKTAIRSATIATETEKSVAVSWPSVLWEVEREKIRNDLLGQMDLMQRLLLTNDRKTDDDVTEEVAAISVK